MSTTGIGLASTGAAAPSFVSGNTTSVTALADGATVTTVRDRKSEIISIATTPPTRPPEPGASPSPAIDLTV